MKHPIYSAAYLLNPKYLGQRIVTIDSSGGNMGESLEDDLEYVLRRYLNPNGMPPLKGRTARDVNDECEDADSEDYTAAMLDYAKFRSSGLPKQTVALARGENALSPWAFWVSYCMSRLPALAPVAIKIVSKITSASACERHWSGVELLLGKRRCSMGSARLGKLVRLRQLLSCGLSAPAWTRIWRGSCW
jgi:hypothetical protein